ncbi:MAG: type III pantothenate kinase, partial [Ignavibacteria bacterium]|nr:type III pantothenate kinase [Ignavibacteria bacterium]
MKLAIDIGNTLAKAAFFSEKGMSEVLVFDLNQTESLIEWLEKVSFSGVGMIASVKPVPENLLNELASRIKISVLDHSTSLPFKITYNTPETLGRDRIAGVAAAFGAFPNQNVLIIDMGTCITYDILTAEGDYQGGAISPGINMRFAAMEAFTSRLPLANPTLSAP